MPIAGLFSCMIEVFFPSGSNFSKIFFRIHVSVFSGIWVQVRGLGHRAILLGHFFLTF